MNKTVLFKLLSLLIIATSTSVLTACGSDDDDNGNGNSQNNWGKFDSKLTTPKYENESALYQIKSENSDIASIELTSSGNYIVIYNNYSYKAPLRANSSNRKQFLMTIHNQMTRGKIDYIVEGKFKKISDTKYELEDWGIIEIKGSSDNALTLVINRNGNTSTVPVDKKTQMPSKENTNFICRTWDFSSISMTISLGGRTIYDKEYKITELKSFGRDMYELTKKYYPEELDEDDTLEDYLEDWNIDDYPTGIIFTKSGTYVCLYKNEELAVSTWTWENYDTGLLRYSWNYNDMYDPYDSGNVKVGSRGEQLQISENIRNRNSDYKDEDEGETIMIYYLNEAK